MKFLFPFQRRKLQAVILCILAGLLLIGLCSKFYQGPHYHWVKNYCGDIVFVMFFYFLFKLFRPYFNSFLWGGLLFLFMIGIEFSQELRWRILDHIRSTFIGVILIGEYFDPKDILYYFIGIAGGVAGYEILFCFIQTKTQVSDKTPQAQQLVMCFDDAGTMAPAPLSKSGNADNSNETQ
jgi:Kef-type K+ transport system membrane component KefB